MVLCGDRHDAVLDRLTFDFSGNKPVSALIAFDTEGFVFKNSVVREPSGAGTMDIGVGIVGPAIVTITDKPCDAGVPVS